MSGDGILTIEEVLKSCIERERLSVRLYTQAMETISDPESRTILGSLREEEVNHIRLLKQALESGNTAMLGKTAGTSEFSSPASGSASSSISDSASPKELVAFAIQHEERAIVYFTRYVNAFRDTDLGDLFMRLLREEEGHRDKLKKKFKKYL